MFGFVATKTESGGGGKKKAPAKAFSPAQWGMGTGSGRRRNNGMAAGAEIAPPDPQATELTCTVTGVKPRYLAPDGSFAIWAAVWEPEEGKTREVTIKGPLARVNSGEMLRCTGRWQKHPQHGWGFIVDDYRSALPQNASGVAAWLENRVDGVGPTFAKAIVDHFGHDKVFDILDADPTRLREVRTAKGRALPEKQVEKAIAAWDDAKAIRQIETFLFSHGVTANLADRLYRHYGEKVIEIMQSTPYRITEMRGIGFKIADRVARSMGVDLDDPARVEAGIIYVLEEAEGAGHVFLGLEQLLGAASTALEVTKQQTIADAASRLAAQGKLVVESDEHLKQRIYLRRLHTIECRLARRIREMLGPAPGALYPKPERPTAPKGATPEELADMILPTDEQWEVAEDVRNQRLTIMTGGPGVGKSATIKLLVDLADKHGLRLKLAAPTGKAARRMQELTGHTATTIHRLLEFSPFEGGFQRDETNPIEADLVVVDEASMLSLDLADSLFRAIPDEAHVLLVGDPDQLPPVGVGRVLDDLMLSERIPTVRLTKIFRQAARSMIIQNSRRINAGKLPYLRQAEAEQALGQKMLNDFYWVTRKTAEQTLELTLDMVINRIPRTFGFDPKTEIMVLAPMRKGVVGLEVLNRELEKRLNSDRNGNPKKPIIPKRGICVGSRIVQTKNSYAENHYVMNGEIALVMDHDPVKDEALLSLDDGEREIWVPVADMDNYYLAWAMSVHKAQGSQWPCVVHPCSTTFFTMLTRGLTYTAVTRASKLCVLVGEKKALSIAVSKQEMRKRNSTLAARITDPSLSGELF